MKLAPAISSEDITAVRHLFEEYAGSLEIELCFQGFAAELAGLPGNYAGPRGRLLLATVEGVPAGCGALRPRGDHAGEMKRLYVRPEFQGRGIGRQLVENIIKEARGLGYERLQLDTLPTMEGALRLYASLGFVRCPPYFESPIADNVFMELRLREA